MTPQKILIFFLALFVATVATPTLATNAPLQDGKVLVYINKVDNEKAINLQLANLMQLKTCISILDENGNTYYKEFCKKEIGYLKRFNLEQVPDGNYQLTIQQKGLRIVQFFTIGGGSDLALGPMQRTETFFPEVEKGTEIVQKF